MNYIDNKIKQLFWFLGCGAALFTYFSVIFAEQQHNNLYYWGLLNIPIFAAVAVYFYKKLNYLRNVENLKSNWGKPIERKKKIAESSKLYFLLTQNTSEKKKESMSTTSSFHIDDQTWSDLNMNELFPLLDRSFTTPGEQVLYKLLRTPLLTEEEIEKRKGILNAFQQDEALRNKVGIKLLNLDRQKESTVPSMLWGELPAQTPWNPLFTVLFYAIILAIASIPFLGMPNGMFLVIGVAMVNGFVYMKFKGEIAGQTNSIRYLSLLIQAAKELQEIKDPVLEDQTLILSKITSKLSTLVRKASFIGLSSFGASMGADVLIQYVNIIFLIDLRSFYRTLDEIKIHQEDLKEIFLTVGEIDALLSIASYRAGLTSYVEPILEKNRKLQAVGLKHPLLKDPVPNSFSILDEGALITGSNMSGKSTFLRTVGINVLFSQTICACLAESYVGGYFKIITSISLVDNLESGKSYYLGEAEALLNIIKACNEEIPTLCIIDEIFRGTNSLERINAAIEILRYLVQHNALPLVATHDLELTDMVKDLYHCYYFSEAIGELGLVFDYKIKDGVSTTRNAIRLLEYLEYPEEITRKTNERIANAIVSEKPLYSMDSR
jgi:hypothetical protein